MVSTFFTNPILNKVPVVTLVFWIIKVLSTTVGETAADYLAVDLHFGLGITSLIMFALLTVFLIYQVIKSEYKPWLYWTNIVLVSVVGTLITDNLVDVYGVSLQAATLSFSLLLALVFWVWYKAEGTLSITSITTRKRELFYWLAILFTFALGTAAGDLVSEGLNLGYLGALVWFSGAIIAIMIAHYLLGLNAILSFWLAYILTRPLGASIGDWLSQSTHDGGLGLGAMMTSLIFLALILGSVVYLTFQNSYKKHGHKQIQQVAK